MQPKRYIPDILYKNNILKMLKSNKTISNLFATE